MRALLLTVLLAGAASAAPLPVTLTDIGVAAAVRGAVNALAPGQPKAVGRVVASGQPLYLNDKVKTGKGGRLQIMLLDETTFTIGQDSEMILDEFVYDPATNKGKVSAQIVKGAFRFVTGKVARRDVGDMRVGLPSGTIGIRGTIVEGVVQENGDADVSLGGPGQDNNADEDPGGITVTNANGSVDIDNSGYMTSIRGGGAPTPPVRVTPEFKQQSNIVEGGEGGSAGGTGESAAAGGGAGGGSESGSGESAAGDSGDANAQSDAHAQMLFEDAETGQPEQAQFAAQEVTSTSGGGIQDGLGRWEDVQLLSGGGGSGSYSGSGAYTCGGTCSGGGDFSFQLAVDFTNKSVGGSGSSLSLANGPLAEQFTSISAVSYAGFTSGPAVLDLSSALSPGSFNSASLQFLNKNGVAAREGTLSFGYDNAGATASGSATGPLGDPIPQ